MGNEANFTRFLHKSVRHISLTLHSESFRFWLWIRGDIRNRKMTPWLVESGSTNSPTRRVGESPILRLGESAIECLKENSLHQWVGDLPSQRVDGSHELGSSQLSDFASWSQFFDKCSPIGNKISLDLYVCLLLQRSLVRPCLKCDYKLPATKVPEPVYVKLKLQIYNHGLITCIER
jgi:hypothetical protein